MFIFTTFQVVKMLFFHNSNQFMPNTVLESLRETAKKFFAT